MTDAFLVVEHLCIALAGRPVLDDISFALPQRGLVALVGPNGAGKTTLLRALARLLTPRDEMRGAIRFDGRDLAAMPLAERALRIAYLPQGHQVHWPLPARDVVALGRTPHGATDPSRLVKADAAAVDRAIAAAEVAAFADRPVTELSGGERSRVALARVLAAEAGVILADEPIASLDPRWQIEVMSVLARVARVDSLVVVVTHDLGLAARFADRVLVLDHGRLAASGPAETALNDATLRQVFNIEVFRGARDGAAVIVPWAGSKP
ncbi:ABC transporter ATP-binding protein [Bradyrhizobium sp. WD16]|uniref:ABC transporter ATP-binding protein n=1 Tax=Bradyrhizobium sp. WD16 TaxID=1521768 RepID=UPI0020A3A643|nr:ABC transporter ATP-binding protein [Bradyrhizobium sp. WD16]UTD26471.1 ABC transporter [Bradyrhizobium sp. WD16]